MSDTDSLVELPPLHATQQLICEDPARFRVLACGRRWGKTFLGIMSCLITALHGGRAWWVSSTFETANEGWDPLKAIASDFAFAQVREAKRTIYFRIPGQPIGRIQVRSADRPEGLRGPGLDLVVLDEAAFCQERAWTHALRPALSDRRGRALLISTPNGKNWFHKLWERGQTDALHTWKSWQVPSWDSPLLEKDEIVQARSDSHPTVFAQEWGAEFLDLAQLRPYKAEWLLDYDPKEIPPLQQLFICIGVDPAISKRDTASTTALSVAGQAVSGPMQSTALVLDHLAGHWSPYETVDRLLHLVQLWKPRKVRIEDVAYQRALKDILVRESQDRGIQIPMVDLAKPELDKLRRALNVSPLVESGRVLFNPKLTALKRSLIAVPDDKAAWDDADAFELALQGLPLRAAQRTPLVPTGQQMVRERRALSYAIHTGTRPGSSYGPTPPPPSYDMGRWRRDLTRGRQGQKARQRAQSYAIVTSPRGNTGTGVLGQMAAIQGRIL